MNLRLSHYLFILISAPLISFGYLFYSGKTSMKNMGDLVTKLYKHPYQVTNNIKQIKTNILEMRCKELDGTLLKPGSTNALAENKKQILNSFDILDAVFLGDKTKLQNLQASYQKWSKEVSGKTRNPASSSVREEDTYDTLMNSLNEINNFATKKASEFYTNSEDLIKKNQKTFLYTIVLCSALTLLIGFIFSNILSKRLLSIINRLKSTGDIVSTQSSEVQSSSESLADSTNESASAIQESASSMEELSAMVKNNVGQADKTKELATNMEESAQNACEKAITMIRSMEDISNSNDDIGKLVSVIEEIADKSKIIDDIVFQTKILSFNASVEAERAGEYGRGFSVVAQEVSNLAKISGKASTEITQIVKESVKNAQKIFETNKERVKVGTELVNETASLIKNIEEDASIVKLNAEQILSASQDQSAGITQMNEAISQLDLGTQHNASLAKQSSSASYELKKETEVLEAVVAQLECLVKKNNGDKNIPSENSSGYGSGNILSFHEKRSPVPEKLNEKSGEDLIKKVSNGATSWEEL